MSRLISGNHNILDMSRLKPVCFGRHEDASVDADFNRNTTVCKLHQESVPSMLSSIVFVS